MKFKCNGKNVNVKIGNSIYKRHAIKTHFIKQNEDYLEVIKTYVLPIYKKGDIISISEKIIALCQNKVVERRDIKIGFLAKFLSFFASRNSHGIGVGEAIKMQYAINKVGSIKCIYAAVVSGITKLFGKKGVFYEIVGQDVSGLDGFYDHVWDEYKDIGIELPDNPNGVCEEIYNKLGVLSFIVDANDLGQEILGVCSKIKLREKSLHKLIKDNPAGQGKETTPIILIRKTNRRKRKNKNENFKVQN